MRKAYSRKRHEKSDAIRKRIGDAVYSPPLYRKDVELKYLSHGDLRDLEKGIDLFADGIPTGERLREAYSEKGKDLCILDDITIRTRTKDGKRLEMYTSKAKDFVYAVENYGKNGICRAYRADMVGVQKHFLKGDFSCKEIQNVDGNFFVAIKIHELDKYNLIKAKYPSSKVGETLDEWL